MNDSLIHMILEEDAKNKETLSEKALALFNVDLNDAASIQRYIRQHPNAELPDIYMGLGNSRNIFISHHDQIYNGLPHKHAFFELVYVEKGMVSDVIDGKEIILKENELCIHNPNARHMIASCGADDLLINILISKKVFGNFINYDIFNDKGLEGFFDTYMSVADSPHYLAFHDPMPEISTLMELLIEEYFHPQKSELMLHSTLLLLFGKLLRARQQDHADNAIMRYINENLADISLEKAAAHFQYHPKYFSSMVKSQTGKKFKELLIDLRLHRATYYLEYTDMSIDEIALAVGYKKTAGFYDKFHKKYQMTPGEYREERQDFARN